MQQSERYNRWNTALLDQFFRPRLSGDPVYLAVDDDELEDIGTRLGVTGDPARDLGGAVRERLGGRGLVAFVRQVPGWRKQMDEPPYVGFLALTVLAASRMAADPGKGVYGNDYYARLNPLLNRHRFDGPPPGFDRVRELWKDLARWLDHDLAGGRGRSTIQGHPHFVHIGWPMSQCVLRASDRARLPDFFRFAGFEPREAVSGQRLLSLFRVWARPGCGLSGAGLRTAASPTGAMQEQLADVLTTELASWDGELRDARGRRRGEALLFAERKAGGRRLELSLYARRLDGFPDGPFRIEGGTEVRLNAGPDGWYLKLPFEVTGTRLARPLRLTQGQYSVSFLPEEVIPMREAFQPSSGWLEARQVVPFEPHMVLLRTSAKAAVEAFAQEYAEPGWRIRVPAGLPNGWLMLDGLRINSAPSDVPSALLRLAPRRLASLSLVGGLPLASRTYLTGGEPDVQVTFEDVTSAVVELDGIEQRFSTAAVELPLADQRLRSGEHVIETGGQRRSFSTVTGFGLVRPDHAGDMALALERHSAYVPASAEAELLSPLPPKGTVHVAGAHIAAAPEDLPLVPPRPVVLRRKFLRWQLLGSRVGDVQDGGATPPRPDWFRYIPGSPSCQFFEVHPAFEPELVVYTGKGGVVVRPLVEHLSAPNLPQGGPVDDAKAWSDVVCSAHGCGAQVDSAAQDVWALYVAIAEELQ